MSCGQSFSLSVLEFPISSNLYLLPVPYLLPVQIVIGSMLIKPFRKWVQEGETLADSSAPSSTSAASSRQSVNGVAVLTEADGMEARAEVKEETNMVNAVTAENQIPPYGAIASGGSGGATGAVTPLSAEGRG